MPAPLPQAEAQTIPNEPSSNRRPDIQGLRAIAVLLVVAFHAGLPVPGGFIGVDIFFVISGFVITAMLHREWRQTGRIRFRRFYLRRFKRLTPALALVVAVAMFMSIFVLSPFGAQQNAAKTAIGSMMLVANFVIFRTTGGYFDAPAETNPLLNTWSLSVEEQFYLAFPALIALGWMLAHRKGLLRFSPPALIFGVGIVSFALAWKGAEILDVLAQQGFAWRSPEIFIGFYSPFTRAWEFAAGAFLALTLAKWTVQAPRLLTGSGLVGAAMLAASLWLITDTTPFPGAWTLLPVTGTLLLLYAGTNPTAPTSQVLSTRPMVKGGDWSYSIYLWHWPMIVFAVTLWPDRPMIAVIAAVFSLAPALASYHWVEQPIRNLRITSRSRVLRLITTTVLVPTGLALALLFTAHQGWWSQQVFEFKADISSMHIGGANDCWSRAPLAPESAVNCVWNKDGTGPPIYVLGDSNADHFTEGFVDAGAALDRPVYGAYATKCPFISIDFSDEHPVGDSLTCQTYVDQSLMNLKSAQPGLVVISNSSYWVPDEAEGITMSQFRAGLSDTIQQIRGDGHQVLLVQKVPDWGGPGGNGWDPRLCPMISILRGSCAAELPLDQALAHRVDERAVISQVASREGATVWDPADSLCPDDTCSTSGPGYIRYTDATHISVPQAKALAPTIREVLASLS